MKPVTDQAYKLMHQGNIALAQVEANGIKIDTDYLERAIGGTNKRIKKITKNLKGYKAYKKWRKIYGSEMNLDSREQLGKIIFEVMGYDCPSETKGGKPQANEENLRSTKLKFAEDYLRLQKLKKARSTYLRGILRETVDGFLHPNFPLNIAQSYRGSSDHPNFQNIPIKDPEIKKLIRRAFIARRKHRIVEVDFKGAEVCNAACYHKDPRMIKYITNPKSDMHRDMATQIYICNKNQVSWGMRDNSKNRFVFPEFYGDWYLSRAIDLWNGIEEMDLKLKDTDIDLYSHLEANGIYELGDCDPEEKPRKGTFEKHLKEIEDDFWNRRFKVYNKWKKDWWSDYLERGWFKTLTGFVIAGNLDRKQAINYPIQGSAFHWLLWSLIQIQKALNKYKMRSLIVGQIHDSIVGDIHKDEFKDYLEIVQEVIYEKIRKHWKWIIVPLKVEVEAAPVGGSWYEKEEVKL